MAPTKPTAATFFASRPASDRTKIQGLLDSIAAGAARDKVLSEVTNLGASMSAADREKLVDMAYQQLAAR